MKSKKYLWIACASVLALIIVTTTVFALKAYFSPKARLLRGIQNTVSKENLGTDLAAIYDLLQRGAYITDSDLTISRATLKDFKEFSYAEGLSLQTNLQMDRQNSMLFSSSSISYLMKPYGNLNLYMDKDIAAIQIPTFNETYYSVNPNRFGEEFNASLFSSLTNIQLEEDLSIQLFRDTFETKEADSLVTFLKDLEILETDVVKDSFFVLENTDEKQTAFDIIVSKKPFTIYLCDKKVYGISLLDSEDISHKFLLQGSSLTYTANGQDMMIDLQASLSSSESHLLSLEIESLTLKTGQGALTLYGSISLEPLDQPITIPFTTSTNIKDITLDFSSMLPLLH